MMVVMQFGRRLAEKGIGANVKIVNREFMLGYAPFPDHKKPNYTIRPSALLRLKLK